MPVGIHVKRLEHGYDLPLPVRMTPGSSGCDIRAAVKDDLVIPPSGRVLVPSGFCFEIPQGYEVQVRPRSGLALKHGVTVLNAPGTIDADYRGEVCIILANLGREPFTVRRGDRIAQLVAAPVANHVEFCEVTEITETGRGGNGFGHTGV